MPNLSNLKLGIYEKAIPLQLSWREKLQIAKDSGFDFVEFSVDGLEPRIHRLAMSDTEIAEIRRAVEDVGIPFLTMALTAGRYYPLGDDRPEIRTRGIEIVKQGIDLAVKLGIRAIQIAGYDVFQRESTPETDRLYRQALRICTDYAALNAVMLSIEIMDIAYSNTAEKVLQFVEEINSPFLQIYADTSNPVAAGLNSVLDLEHGKGHIIAVHIKDGYLGCCREVPYGEGIVDFDTVFKTLKSTQYSGLLVAEMWCNEDLSFIPYLRTANDFIRSKIRNAT